MAENQPDQVDDTFGDAEVIEEEQIDTSLAEEALKEGGPAETSPEEGTVPVGVVKELREDLREAREQIAEFKGRLTAYEQSHAQQTTTTTEKSPLEQAAEEQGCSVDEVVMDGRLHIAQREFEKKQDEQKKEAEAQTTMIESAQAQYLKLSDHELKKAGIDADSVIRLGKPLLDDGDKVMIAKAGSNILNETYKRCQSKIEASNLPQCVAMKAQFKVYKDSHTTKEKPPKPDEKPKEKGLEPEEEVDVGISPQSKSLANFICG